MFVMVFRVCFSEDLGVSEIDKVIFVSMNATLSENLQEEIVLRFLITKD